MKSGPLTSASAVLFALPQAGNTHKAEPFMQQNPGGTLQRCMPCPLKAQAGASAMRRGQRRNSLYLASRRSALGLRLAPLRRASNAYGAASTTTAALVPTSGTAWWRSSHPCIWPSAGCRSQPKRRTTMGLLVNAKRAAEAAFLKRLLIAPRRAPDIADNAKRRCALVHRTHSETPQDQREPMSTALRADTEPPKSDPLLVTPAREMSIPLAKVALGAIVELVARQGDETSADRHELRNEGARMPPTAGVPAGVAAGHPHILGAPVVPPGCGLWPSTAACTRGTATAWPGRPYCTFTAPAAAARYRRRP